MADFYFHRTFYETDENSEKSSGEEEMIMYRWSHAARDVLAIILTVAVTALSATIEVVVKNRCEQSKDEN